MNVSSSFSITSYRLWDAITRSHSPSGSFCDSNRLGMVSTRPASMLWAAMAS